MLDSGIHWTFNQPAIKPLIPPEGTQGVHAVADQQPGAVIEILVRGLFDNGFREIVWIDLRPAANEGPKTKRLGSHFFTYLPLAIAYSFDFVAM